MAGKTSVKELSMDEKNQIEFSKKFIKITQKILTQGSFNEVENPNQKREYKNALFINCLYGLLMMPLKLNNESIKMYGDAKSVLSENNLLGDDKITFKVKEDETPTFEQFVRSIRNGLGHWNESRKNDSFPQGVKIESSDKFILSVSGSYTLYKSKKRENDKIVHITTFINFSNKELLLKFSKLVTEPNVCSVKIERSKTPKKGSCAWKKTKVYLGSRMLDCYKTKRVLLQSSNELRILIGDEEKIYEVKQLPVEKSVEINGVTYRFVISEC